MDQADVRTEEASYCRRSGKPLSTEEFAIRRTRRNVSKWQDAPPAVGIKTRKPCRGRYRNSRQDERDECEVDRSLWVQGISDASIHL